MPLLYTDVGGNATVFSAKILQNSAAALATEALAEAEHWLAQSLAYHAAPHQIKLDMVE